MIVKTIIVFQCERPSCRAVWVKRERGETGKCPNGKCDFVQPIVCPKCKRPDWHDRKDYIAPEVKDAIIHSPTIPQPLEQTNPPIDANEATE